MVHSWDPDRYLTYADQRGRPFVDLLARIGAERPARVVDLGCGPGNLTGLLAQRWPGARVEGLDSSPAMVRRARADVPGVSFEVADLRSWTPREPVDVLVSNATLQWVPNHLDLLPRLVSSVRTGGWFAFQVPSNADQPSTTVRTELSAAPLFADHTRTAATVHSHAAEVYLQVLSSLGCDVDVWETTYFHVLHGADAVFDWISATGARPTLEALPPDLRPEYEDELKRRLRSAYPETEHGVILPFRRIFAVAQVAPQVTDQ